MFRQAIALTLLGTLAPFCTAATRTKEIPPPPRVDYEVTCDFSNEIEQPFINMLVHLKNNGEAPIHTVRVRSNPSLTASLAVIHDGVPLPTVGADPEKGITQFAFSRPVSKHGKTELALEARLRQNPLAYLANGQHAGIVDGLPALEWGTQTFSDFELRAEVPDGIVVLTTGRWNPAKGVFVAKDIRSFGILLAKGMQVLQRDVGDTLVQALTTRAGTPCAQLLVATAADAITFYRQRFGFYPQDVLTIVPGMDRPAGGCPIATNIVAIHGEERMTEMPEEHWQWITAHEIGHQYFGERVLEARDAPWLWLGLGLYADREYARHLGLGQRHAEYQNRLVEAIRQRRETRLNLPAEEVSRLDFDYDSDILHGKGFCVISALESLLGAERFGNVYTRCLREFKGRALKLSDFRRLCEEESGQDLDWFFEQWTTTNNYLSYEIASAGSVAALTGYDTKIIVKRLGTLDMPVPISARFEDGSEQRVWTQRMLATQTLEIHSRTPLKEAVLDPDHALPNILPPLLLTLEELLSGELNWGKSESIRIAEAYQREALETLEGGDTLLRVAFALYDAKRYEEALDVFSRMAQNESDESLAFFLVWEGHMLDLLERRPAAIEVYRRAVDLHVPEDAVIGSSQYNLRFSPSAYARERLDEPFMRIENVLP